MVYFDCVVVAFNSSHPQVRLIRLRVVERSFERRRGTQTSVNFRRMVDTSKSSPWRSVGLEKEKEEGLDPEGE